MPVNFKDKVVNDCIYLIIYNNYTYKLINNNIWFYIKIYLNKLNLQRIICSIGILSDSLFCFFRPLHKWYAFFIFTTFYSLERRADNHVLNSLQENKLVI